MKDLGYEWVVLDDCWHPSRAANGTLVPFKVAFDGDGKPLNPDLPHSNRPGRGMLGKWGPNHASDPIVTRRTRSRTPASSSRSKP